MCFKVIGSRLNAVVNMQGADLTGPFLVAGYQQRC
jgi:hypothetical protein